MIFAYYTHIHTVMVFTDSTSNYFKELQYKVRTVLAESLSETPFYYENEIFFTAYEALNRAWIKRQSQRKISEIFSIRRNTLKEWEENFVAHGAIGLLSALSFIEVDSQLERLVVLIKSARPRENSSYALRLSDALGLPGATLDIIRSVQRCHGFGQRLDDKDIIFYKGLQQVLSAVTYHKTRDKNYGHNVKDRPKTFIDFGHDPFQQRIELFKELSCCKKRGHIRAVLLRYGIHQNRYYELKSRFMLYGVWGLVNLINKPRIGEKISQELELKIIEERLMDPSLSAQKMINKLKLKCLRANVQKIYARWRLSGFKKPIPIRRVISMPMPRVKEESSNMIIERSVRSRLPNLIQEANLKVNRDFTRFLKSLSCHRVPVCNPGAIIMAPFLNQLGIIEALHTYGPTTYRNTEITNNIVVNVQRILAGFPTINDFKLNTDRSVAIGSGLVVNPTRSRFYDSLDDLRPYHLQKLRNDAGIRAKELGVIEAKEIAIDYHCDPSDSRFPHDKSLSKSPDKKGDIENYFLNKPTGTSPDKVELHYYCIMLARQAIDYFLSIFCEPKWKMPEGWKCVLSTIRTTIFTNQNCELTVDEEGDLQLTYLDGDPLGLKKNLKLMLERRSQAGLNSVSWWGNRGLKIKIEDRFNFENGSQIT